MYTPPILIQAKSNSNRSGFLNQTCFVLIGDCLTIQALASHEAQDIVYQGQGGYYGDSVGHSSDVRSGVLDEVEIRELLRHHVGHHCCRGSRPATTRKIHAVEDCSVYVGILETFTEERETIIEWEPYLGGKIDGKEKGPEMGIGFKIALDEGILCDRHAMLIKTRDFTKRIR